MDIKQRADMNVMYECTFISHPLTTTFLTDGVSELLEVCQLLVVSALLHSCLHHLHLVSLTLVLVLQLTVSVQ